MTAKSPLVEGIDYYLEDGKFVFTSTYHLKRGYCCNSKCRHCPYGNAPGPNPEVAKIAIGPLPAGIGVLVRPKGKP
ncbi:MAG: DUF5522 domain-containing protein [Polyangiaceae bacterium]